ncbi:MAG: DUF433 domain-containing protein [Chloroflexi bacterium]|nr:DUF433 domain-containing protein [Chloroflexota bacterium]
MLAMTKEELIAKYITQDARRPEAAEARLADYGVHVWAIIGYRQATGEEIDQIAAAYEVPREAIEAAFAYYDRHHHVIDARIAANKEILAA